MGGLETLLWTIPILFTLALLFAILLWCRGWRREERWETDRRLKLLGDQAAKFSEALDRLERIHASSGRLSEQLQALSADLTRLLACLSSSQPSVSGTTTSLAAGPTQRYDQAREMLSAGSDPVEVARRLDLSLGDVQTIQRTMGMRGSASP